MSVIGKAARAVDAFRARREGRTIGEGALASALSLFRTVRLMRDQGEVTTAWVLWASLWCYFVGALVAADALRGLEPWAVVALFRATYDRAQALPSRAAALVAADVLRLHAGALSGLLPVEYRGAAGRVVDAWAGLVRAGLEAAPCAWCVGDPPSPGPAGDPWFRYAPATASKVEAPQVDPCAPRPAPLREAVSGGLVKLFGYWWRADGDDPAGPARFELVALELGELKLWRLAFEPVLGDAGEWGDPRALVEGRAAARGHRVLSVVEPEEIEAVAPSQWWNAMARAEDEIIAAGASKG